LKNKIRKEKEGRERLASPGGDFSSEKPALLSAEKKAAFRTALRAVRKAALI
jgi:hypothetical protein